jgi:hypothetical protein
VGSGVKRRDRRNGGMESGRVERGWMERLRDGRVGGMQGGMEDGRDGRDGGWKDGGMEGWRCGRVREKWEN